ncbi:MAG: hypothetical protein HC896_17930 [Bacteroidales bacterium]|nr:hypothetical protein [Bacteroidales bacterium]
MQTVLWSLTNGDGLTDEYLDFIQGLPDLEEGKYPDVMVNPGAGIPESFEEYSPDGK